MSTNYQFLNKETKESVSLNEVDRVICETYDIEYKDNEYSFYYDVLTLAGVLILKKYGGSEITEEIFDQWIADGDQDRKDSADFYRKFLLDDYIFTAWYTPNY